MMHGLGSLLIVGLLHAAMLAPIAPLSDALATTAAHESESEGITLFDYGWLRASGSAAFIVGTMLSGWAAGKIGLPSIIWCSGALGGEESRGQGGGGGGLVRGWWGERGREGWGRRGGVMGVVKEGWGAGA